MGDILRYNDRNAGLWRNGTNFEFVAFLAAVFDVGGVDDVDVRHYGGYDDWARDWTVPHVPTGEKESKGNFRAHAAHHVGVLSDVFLAARAHRVVAERQH